MMIKNKAGHIVIITLIGLLPSLIYSAAMANCIGCNQIVNLTLTNTLNSESNAPGKTQTSSTFTISPFNNGIKGWQSTSFIGADGVVPPYGTNPDDWVYQRVDDYLSVATRVYNRCGYRYAPYNLPVLDANTCQPGNNFSGDFIPNTFESSIKVTRKLVGGTYRNNLLLGSYGGCAGAGCSVQSLVYAWVYLSYSITVPESCELNVGKIVTVDFGNISTGAFKTAGAKAEGVNPRANSIALQCTNIQQQAALTMRVQADNVNGNAIVSDNPDVGFVVTDQRDNPLTPNLSSSVIPFRLDDTGRSNVTIKTYPVSVTGKKPAEGPVTSRAYLRVDFQ